MKVGQRVVVYDRCLSTGRSVGTVAEISDDGSNVFVEFDALEDKHLDDTYPVQQVRKLKQVMYVSEESLKLFQETMKRHPQLKSMNVEIFSGREDGKMVKLVVEE